MSRPEQTREETPFADVGMMTSAFGKPHYVEQAKWLAMSVRHNAPHMATAVLTDSRDPELRELFTHVVPYVPANTRYLETKLLLDLFTPFDRTLYIDSDCLVVNNLNTLLPLLAGKGFAVPGWRYLTRDDKDANVDVPFVLETFGLEKLPKFNGGCYYFERGSKCAEVFASAREFCARAAELRVHALPSGDIPDEPLFALALAKAGLELTPTGKGGPWTPINSRGPIHLDVFAGTCRFRKEGCVVHPDIVHFPAGFRDLYCYHREVRRLNEKFGRPIPRLGTRARVFVQGAVEQNKRRLRDGLRRVKTTLTGETIVLQKIPEAIHGGGNQC